MPALCGRKQASCTQFQMMEEDSFVAVRCDRELVRSFVRCLDPVVCSVTVCVCVQCVMNDVTIGIQVCDAIRVCVCVSCAVNNNPNTN